MKQLLLILTTLLLPGFLLAQIKFTPGYIVNNKNEKKTCLLLNSGVQHTGENYLYKFHKDSAQVKVDLKKIKAFGVDGGNKFIRQKVSLDISGNSIKHVKDTLNHADWNEGHVFLEEMIASDVASLYYFRYEGREFFFYKKGNSPIINLIYKKYEVGANSQLTTQVLLDNRYKQQLGKNLPCSMKTSRLSYTRSSLLRYFKTYIEEQSEEIETQSQEQKSKFKVQVALTANNTSFALEETKTLQNYSADSEISLGGGVALEYLFPFNRNKWGLFAEGNYVKTSFSYTSDLTTFKYNFDYNFIEIPFGLIHYFNVTEDFKLFVKGGMCTTFTLDDNFSVGTSDYNRGTTTSTNVVAGFGVNYKRFNAEFKFYTKSDITQNDQIYNSEFKRSSIRIAYDVFNK